MDKQRLERGIFDYKELTLLNIILLAPRGLELYSEINCLNWKNICDIWAEGGVKWTQLSKTVAILENNVIIYELIRNCYVNGHKKALELLISTLESFFLTEDV